MSDGKVLSAELLAELSDKLHASLLEASSQAKSLGDKQHLLSLVRHQVDELMKAQEVTFLNAPVLRLGDLVAGRRTPGRTSGSAEPGRIPGLAWEEKVLGSSDIPDGIRSVVTSEVRSLAAAPLPFLRGATIWHFWIPLGASHPACDLDAFAVATGDEQIEYLDWSGGPIHRLNQRHHFRLSADPIGYTRLFFYLVRGTANLYPFTLLESAQDVLHRIPWDLSKAQQVLDSQRALAKIVHGLEFLHVDAEGGLKMAATVFYEHTVFNCLLRVTPQGLVSMEDDQPELASLPVLRLELDSAESGA